MTEAELLCIVVDNDWLEVKGMSHTPPGVLVDIVFITGGGNVRLTGDAHTLRGSGEEAFSLLITEHTKSFMWAEDASGRTNWPQRHLSDEWAGQPIGAMLKAPREARFYTDPELAERTFPANKLLDNCSAIEFIKQTPSGRPQRFVLFASNNNPCNVEIATTPEACDVVLARLLPIEIDWRGS